MLKPKMCISPQFCDRTTICTRGLHASAQNLCFATVARGRTQKCMNLLNLGACPSRNQQFGNLSPGFKRFAFRYSCEHSTPRSGSLSISLQFRAPDLRICMKGYYSGGARPSQPAVRVIVKYFKRNAGTKPPRSHESVTHCMAIRAR